MMTRARGGVWHKKDKVKGIVPLGLTGLDKIGGVEFLKGGWLALWTRLICHCFTHDTCFIAV